MDINWYPGHMAKAVRMIEDNIKRVDLIVYVLDARAPKSTFNKHFLKLIGKKPIIYALNKADLANKNMLDNWIKKLSTKKSIAVAVDSLATGGTKKIAISAQNLCRKKMNKFAEKGVRFSIRAMVAGVSNSGKSTLINNLCGKSKALTGDKPGVTRGKQWVRCTDYLEVLDTPGVLPPKIDDQACARRLAYLGSIREEILDTYDLALAFVSELSEIAPQCIFNRYKVNITTPEQTILDIARARGFVLRGGELDIERAANALLDDFRKGRLGKITLERAEDFELTLHEQVQEDADGQE